MTSIKSLELVAIIVFLLINTSYVSKAQYGVLYWTPYMKDYDEYWGMEDLHRDSKVGLKIYYETHCSSTIHFFKEQLISTVKHLGSYIDIHMIPYGHAKTSYDENGELTFSCQHGNVECYGNKLHACAIDVIKNNTKATVFNICIIERTYDYKVLNNLVNSCGAKLDIPTNPIWECMRTGRGSELLREYGEVTQAMRPRHMPFVVLAGSAEDQNVLTRHLGHSICRLLAPRPSICGLYS